MSAEVCSMSGVQTTTLGGTKPLHRFLKGQPKTIGNIMLVLGTSFFITTVAVMMDFKNMSLWPSIPPTLFLGIQFIGCGILYVLTEHNPTKKTVTISLALSITSLLGVAWTMIHILTRIGHYRYYRPYYNYDYDNGTMEMATREFPIENLLTTFEAVLVIHAVFGAVIVIVMSCLAGAALRSTKTEAVIVRMVATTQTPAEN